MIRTNLATRPFYNERAVDLVILALAIVVLGATMFNITRVVQLSRRDTALVTQATRDEATATQLRARAASLRATVDPHILDAAANDAHLANDLIDRRTFSWTDLFNRFEMTLPDEVRITTVQPKLDPKLGIVLTIVVAARSPEDVNLFIDHLEATGAFSQLQKHDERVDDQTQQTLTTLTSVYTPANARGAETAR